MATGDVSKLKHSLIITTLQLVLTLFVMIYLTSRGWNALEGWAVSLSVALFVNILEAIP